MKKVPTDDKFAMRGETLTKMLEEDKAAGLIPFYVRHCKAFTLRVYTGNIAQKQTNAVAVPLSEVMTIFTLISHNLFYIVSYMVIQVSKIA